MQVDVVGDLGLESRLCVTALHAPREAVPAHADLREVRAMRHVQHVLLCQALLEELQGKLRSSCCIGLIKELAPFSEPP